MTKQVVNFHLYLVTDRHQTQGRTLGVVVEEAARAWVKAVQLREKDLSAHELYDLACHLREITSREGALLFINDRVDIALAVKADGVHLPANGLPLSAVMRLVGNEMLVGISTHQLTEALSAQKEGADFIVFGPIFETPSKVAYGAPQGIDLLKEIRKHVTIPLFAIGGIKHHNLQDVMRVGVDGIALISEVIAAADIRLSVQRLLDSLQSFLPTPSIISDFGFRISD